MVLVRFLAYLASMIILSMTALFAVTEALLPVVGNFCAHSIGVVVATIHVYWVKHIWSTKTS